jgi:hypothetical protein
MNDEMKYIMGMTCALPALICLWRHKKTDSRYRAFMYMMLLVIPVETIRFMAIKNFLSFDTDTLCSNLYILINFGLFLYFTYINDYISKRLLQYFIAAALLLGIANCLKEGSVFAFFYYLLCFVSIIMLFISIDILSRQIMETGTKLLQRFWFWFAGISVLYNAYTLLIFGLYAFSLFDTPNGKTIGTIQTYIVAACYILYIFAALKIPAKKIYYNT